MSKKAALLWVDLEMTGLSPEKDRILEAAVIATDWDLNEIATYESGVKVARSLMKRRMVGEFWEKNAEVRDSLMMESARSMKSSKVEDELVAFVRNNFGKEIYLAGNSIHQDRKFIEKWWPRLNSLLHYRMLDVSAWKIYFEGAKGKKFAKPEMHRAIDDVRGSIEEFKWYLKLKS
ncbi:oligoribonuclease [Candidatus Saccharibacteria bacterium]|nr:oligoribonuclease [Candidatus Saccharibacteria bacterium]